ncbi:hypothetical protein LINGRAHAP2_LOCUS22247 [Linum grandiflorum]
MLPSRKRIGKQKVTSETPKKKKTRASPDGSSVADNNASASPSPSPSPSQPPSLPPLDTENSIFTFPGNPTATAIYDRIKSLPAAPQGRLDIIGLQTRGWLDSLKSYVDRSEIWRLFQVAERAQAWPIIEFLSTFKYNRKKRSWEKSISFRLGGKPQQCSEDEFGRRLGFYTTEQETSGVLAEYRRFPEYSDVAREVFWQSITTGAAPYDPRSSKITLVHKPMLQFLHQFFRTSITHRGKDGSPNVVGVRDLFLFYCLENGMKVHLGSLVAQLFQNLKRNRGAVALYGGGYVTRLVVSYGCMDAYLGAPPSCPYETVLASDFSDLLADRGATNSSSHDGEEEEDAVPTTLEEIQQWKEQTDATLQQYGQTLRGMCDQIEGMSDHIKGMGDQLDRIEEMQREILRAQQH